MKTFRTFGKKAESQQIPQEQDFNQNEDFTDYQSNDMNYRQVEHMKNDMVNYDQNDYNNNYEARRYNVNDPNPQMTMYTNMQQEQQPFVNETNYADFENKTSDGLYDTDTASQEPGNKKHVRINDEATTDEYITDEEKQQQVVTRNNGKEDPRVKYDFHFATKIRNSGYWGKVYLRNGTWMVIAGFIQFCASIVLIGVFWGFWYSNALNFPMRILAITLLSSGCSMMVFGLICNYFMFLDRDNKQILGSPLLPSSKVLAVCLFFLVIASDCITLYYTYWKNRWVNTPLIIIAIVLYFFAGIGALWALFSICEYNLVRSGVWRTAEENMARREKRKEMERRLRYLSQESITKRSLKTYDVLVAEQQEILQSELEEERRKGFRKGHPVKLTPKPVILQSSANAASTNLIDEI